MEIEKQVATLIQSQKLKGLGVEQKSLFYYQEAKSGLHKESVMFRWTSKALCSAFTLAEMYETMDNEERAMIIESVEETLAESVAKHLIWLLETGNIDLKRVNKRLTES